VPIDWNDNMMIFIGSLLAAAISLAIKHLIVRINYVNQVLHEIESNAEQMYSSVGLDDFQP
jgi:hypothetical protein